MNQDTLKHYRKVIRKVPEAENEDENKFLILENLFQAIYDSHTTYKDIYDGENTSNSLFLFPFLKAVATAISTELDSTKTDFCDHYVCLEAMSTQLKSLNVIVNDRTKYKADSLIRMYGFKRLEALLLETSSYFGSTDQPKSKFDHHKGLVWHFGHVEDNYR
ncbi:hypothetical protein G6F62_013378 [Rhizopus arrhizus]|nr:hypothetical protein G6F62_013378 [Rhizopus arrhizus]